MNDPHDPHARRDVHDARDRQGCRDLDDVRDRRDVGGSCDPQGCRDLRVTELVPLLLRAGRGELPARERELAILRIAYLTETSDEWTQHVRLGEAAGLDLDEIAAVLCGPEHPDWSAPDAALLRAVDELHRDAGLSEPTRERLARFLDRPQTLELVAIVSVYVLAGYILSSSHLRLDGRAN